MVNITVAGGTGQVAREVLDALVATKKHTITVLSRTNAADAGLPPSVGWKAVDYDDKESLVDALRGTHTLLSFVQVLFDPEGTAQKNLIDAAIAAGVKRFAPSEHVCKDTDGMPWMAGKGKTREYLKAVNADGDVLEYTLFQPGLFLDYLAFPYRTNKHLGQLQSLFDFQHCRAMVLTGHEDTAVLTLTAVADFAAVVARAVDYEGRWPVDGGICGNRLTFAEIMGIGERVRGQAFAVDRLEARDLEAGRLESSWNMEASHYTLEGAEAADMIRLVTIQILLSSARGAWDSSDEMNRLFPDFEFTKAEEFLRGVFEGKPEVVRGSFGSAALMACYI